MREYLKNLSVHYKGDYVKIKRALMRNETVADYPCSYEYVCIGDGLYPKALYDLEQPPFVLYYVGNIGLLQHRTVSVVGSRNPSGYAVEMCIKLVERLRSSYCIVSGLAKGIDGIAHETALDFSTVGVLGCGIDVMYPVVNKRLFESMRESHCIVSEYPPGVKPERHYFPFRNRIVVALGERLFVMSAALKSGTMTSVNEALSINRHVICLPHPINDLSGYGCNVLIKEGADILTNIEEI